MPRASLTIEKAWNILFETHDILARIVKDGVFLISSAEINKVKEARLMAKFDLSVNLPGVFRKNGLSILPVSRGGYAIGRFAAYEPVSYSNVKPRLISDPGLETLDATNLYSEASALLFAYNSGIIADILGSSNIHFTVNGRMSSGDFSYRIDNTADPSSPYSLTVRGAQVEIDAGYESPDAFCICEAKNIASQELLIRQLYYPFRLWRSKITKPVIPVFSVFSNDTFHIFRYRFEALDYYNSIRLEEHRAYVFGAESIGLDDVVQLWRSLTPQENPYVTFPQADKFERVVDLLSLLHERSLTRDEVTLRYSFVPRQTDYYVAACRYLGLVEQSRNVEGERSFRLTEDARIIMEYPYKKKLLALIRRVLERPVFHRVFGLLLESGALADKRTIVKIMLKEGIRLAENTTDRRASTVQGWISWIASQYTTQSFFDRE